MSCDYDSVGLLTPSIEEAPCSSLISNLDAATTVDADIASSAAAWLLDVSVDSLTPSNELFAESFSEFLRTAGAGNSSRRRVVRPSRPMRLPARLQLPVLNLDDPSVTQLLNFSNGAGISCSDYSSFESDKSTDLSFDFNLSSTSVAMTPNVTTTVVSLVDIVKAMETEPRLPFPPMRTKYSTPPRGRVFAPSSRTALDCSAADVAHRCRLCRLQCPSSKALRKHFERVHGAAVMQNVVGSAAQAALRCCHKCPECGSTFLSEARRRTHLFRHHPESAQRHNMCRRVAPTAKPAKFTCPHCLTECSSHTVMQKHVESYCPYTLLNTLQLLKDNATENLKSE